MRQRTNFVWNTTRSILEAMVVVALVRKRYVLPEEQRMLATAWFCCILGTQKNDHDANSKMTRCLRSCGTPPTADYGGGDDGGKDYGFVYWVSVYNFPDPVGSYQHSPNGQSVPGHVSHSGMTCTTLFRSTLTPVHHRCMYVCATGTLTFPLNVQCHSP